MGSLVISLIFGMISCSSRESLQDPLNVLFIAVDDMNNDLGCFGNKRVHSPNIDRLAEMGIVFDHAYCQFPLCSPSRSSILTGLRPDSTRVFDLRYHFRQGLPDVVTLPQMFIQNNYFVARVGKMYHYGNPGDIGTNGLDDKASWMERYNPAGLDKTALEVDVMNYTPSRGLGAALAWYADPQGTDAQHTDGKVADETIRLLEEHRGEPFLIAAGFYKPHCPWIAPSAYFDSYPIEGMVLPAITAQIQDIYPSLALASTNPWPYFGVTPDEARQSKLAYYASISFVDAQIGRLLNAVDALGLLNNTIIVFWSDHGYHLGEHGLWFKQSLFEESTKCPLIIAVPGSESKGKVSKRIVELVDIFPTLAELTGLKPPEGLQGHSLVPLLENPDAEWSHPAFSQVERTQGPGYSVRTEKYRLTKWLSGTAGRELYDEVNDAPEEHNLADDPSYKEVMASLDSLLHAIHPHVVTGGVAEPDTREKFSD